VKLVRGETFSSLLPPLNGDILNKNEGWKWKRLPFDLKERQRREREIFSFV
jgi:hypothetical protein